MGHRYVLATDIAAMKSPMRPFGGNLRFLIRSRPSARIQELPKLPVHQFLYALFCEHRCRQSNGFPGTNGDRGGVTRQPIPKHKIEGIIQDG